MPATAKRYSRILLIVIVVALLIAGWRGVVTYREGRLDTAATAARTTGREALARGDYGAALADLGAYCYRFDGRGATSEDYLLCARARRNVAKPNRAHLVDTIALLRRAVELDPASKEARNDLLDVYLETRYITEALAVVDEMLAAEPGDGRLLRTKCQILESQRQFKRALAVSKELNEKFPADLVGYFRTLRLLIDVETPVPEIDAWIAGVATAHAGDPAVELLRAAAFSRRHDEARAKECLDRVLSGTPLADPQFVELLVAELDAAGRFDDSMRALERMNDSTSPVLARELARRLWFAGRSADVVQHVESWKQDAVRNDPEVLALYSMALRGAGRIDDARAVRKDLAGRTDAVGKAWSAFIEHTWSDDTADRSADVAALAAAMAAVPDSAFIRQALGDAYAAMGETDLALEMWTTASARAPSWSLPMRRIAQTMLDTGREHLAPTWARGAVMRSPNDLAAISIYARATATASASSDADGKQIDRLLAWLKSLDSDSIADSEDRLPTYVDLLVRRDRSAAEQRLNQALESKTPASETTLLRLARTAARAGIPLEAKFLDLSESLHGVTPQLAFARALFRARDAGDQAGLRTLDELRSRAAPANGSSAALEWDLVRTTYLDVVGRPDAGPAWIAFADAHPTVLSAQLGALGSVAAWSDRAAIARLIDRVKDLSHDQGITWRIARARLLLSAPDASEPDLAEAAKQLTDVIRIAPRSSDAHALLAQALEKLRNLPGAEEQLRLASELAPDNTWISLEIARLQLQQGHGDVARRLLDRVLASRDLPPEQVEHAAYLLAMQGDRRRGAELLDPIVARPDARRDGVLLLARLYAKLGEPARALALCEKLLATANSDVILLAADLYSSLGRTPDADAVLRRLDGVDLQPGERELVHARHASYCGDAASARDWYRKAVQAAPDRGDAWTEFVEFALGSGDLAAITEILDHPKAAEIDSVVFLKSIRPMLAAAVQDVRSRSMLLAAIDDKAQRAVLTDAVRVTTRDWSDPSKRPAVAKAVRALADSNANVLALQLLAADMSAATGNLRGGCDLASRAMMQFPNSSAAARQAAEMLAAAGRWDDSLQAALAWRDRSSRADLRPEICVAQALLRLGRAADAAGGLDGAVAVALARPTEFESLILLYEVALVRSGRVARANDLCADMARKSERWRGLAVGLDVEWYGDAAGAAAWLRMCATITEATDVPARIELARAWGAAWDRFRSAELLDGARGVVQTLLASPDVSAEAFLVAGTIEQGAGDVAAAKEHYGAALSRDPSMVAARNNLAMILAETGDWQAAVREATRATETAPSVADCFETLAYAHTKGREFAKAEAALGKAIELEPLNPAWQISLGETLAEAGDVPGAKRAVLRADEIVANGIRPSETLRERLDKLRGRVR